MPPERQDGRDPRPPSHEEDMDVRYEDSRALSTLKGLEQRFVDDIMKLSKEQTGADDAENARPRKRIMQSMRNTESSYQHSESGAPAGETSFSGKNLNQDRSISLCINVPPALLAIPVEEEQADHAVLTTQDSHDSYRDSDSAKEHGYETKAPNPRGHD